MSFTTLNGNVQRQPGLAPSLLAACITLALLPSTSLAAPAEETVIVEGSAPRIAELLARGVATAHLGGAFGSAGSRQGRVYLAATRCNERTWRPATTT